MYRKCSWWGYVIVGLAVGVLMYLLLPLKWLTVILSLVLLYIGCLVMFR